MKRIVALVGDVAHVTLVGDVAHVTTIGTYVSHVKSANNVRWDRSHNSK